MYLAVGPGGYQVLTLDHASGALRLDLGSEWLAREAPCPLLPPAGELLCSPGGSTGGTAMVSVSQVRGPTPAAATCG